MWLVYKQRQTNLLGSAMGKVKYRSDAQILSNLINSLKIFRKMG